MEAPSLPGRLMLPFVSQAIATVPQPLLADVPAWLWAALLMAAFVGVGVLTMWLTRYPVRRAPPPLAPRPRDGETERSDDEGARGGE